MPIYMRIEGVDGDVSSDTFGFKPELTKTDYSGGGTWLAEDHGPSDPSDGLKPTESLLPMDSLRVDPNNPNTDAVAFEHYVPSDGFFLI
jgi:hypothetical protein